MEKSPDKELVVIVLNGRRAMPCFFLPVPPTDLPVEVLDSFGPYQAAQSQRFLGQECVGWGGGKCVCCVCLCVCSPVPSRFLLKNREGEVVYDR